MAQGLATRPLNRGCAVLLFQPAEETGAGAAAVAADPRLAQLRPQRVFALHNLPGYPLGQVLLRSGPFCAGSVGLVARLTGRTSHAAYPERGRSPAAAMSRLLPGLVSLPVDLERAGSLAMVTVVHARLGEVAFGTAPGDADVYRTKPIEGLLTARERLMERSSREDVQVGRCHGSRRNGIAAKIGDNVTSLWVTRLKARRCNP